MSFLIFGTLGAAFACAIYLARVVDSVLPSLPLDAQAIWANGRWD
jgi:hypothetical protein